MILAVVVSFLTGFTIVLSRSLNARLAQYTNPIVAAIYNNATGLAGSIVIFAVVWLFGAAQTNLQAAPWWAYMGGLLGVVLVWLLNSIVTKISSFYMTLLSFLGQVATGIALDALLGLRVSPGMVLGGIAITVGLTINMMADREPAPRPNTKGK